MELLAQEGLTMTTSHLKTIINILVLIIFGAIQAYDAHGAEGIRWYHIGLIGLCFGGAALLAEQLVRMLTR